MNIADLFKKDKTVFSFEVFPPKKESGIETIYSTLEQLKELKPDFISVTYGAGGVGVANATTIDLCSLIKNKHGIETIAHLSCLYNTKESVDAILEQLKENGIENILALRGDENPNFETKKDFKYASDLTEYILSKNEGFNVSGACYPEVHQEAPNMVEDIKNLKKKVDAGADHLISQLFFDNEAYYDFIEKVRIAGIDVPIEAGIMPVTNKSQIERMVSMCGASIPAKLSKVLQRFGDDPVAMRDAGISYAIDQIIDLTANGVDGIHIYTMNDPYVARKITESVSNIVKVGR
jgi:methylenetetrahydrofolate reductase (NADPH)